MTYDPKTGKTGMGGMPDKNNPSKTQQPGKPQQFPNKQGGGSTGGGFGGDTDTRKK